MFKVTTQPVAEPVTLQEAKDHLRVETTDEDDLINIYIQSARETVEKHTNRAIMTQTVKQYLDCFPVGEIETRFSPIQSITSVKYFDSDDIERTLVKDTDYREDLISEPARITPINNWPTTKARPNAVVIEFVAGYPSAGDVPANIKQAIFLLIGEMYEVRENTVKRLPTAVDQLLSPCKVIL